MSEESNFNTQDLLDFSDNTSSKEDNSLVNDLLDQISPSAPPAPSSDDFIVVNGDKGSGSSNSSESQEDTNKMLLDIANSIQDSLKTDKIVAEADSPSAKPAAKVEPPSPAKTATEPKRQKNEDCAICPYYMLVRDLLLWRNPKYSGIVFGSELVLLISLASFSLLTIVGSLLLLAMTAVGAYRFYLALMFRIKGTPDQTFEKLSKYDIALPKEKVKQLSSLLEEDVNKVIRKTKSIILWDNVITSSVAYVGFYFVYCVGSVFNTLTLLILALVSAFTLPKVYEIYKQPIDDVLQKTTSFIHVGVSQVMKKLPFLSKKKVQ